MTGNAHSTLGLVGRILAAAGGATLLVAAFVPNYGFEGDTYTMWQQWTRWDAVNAVVFAALAAIAVVAIVRATPMWDAITLMLGGYASTFLMYVVEPSDGQQAGSYLLALGGALALVGSVLLVLRLSGLQVGAPAPTRMSSPPPAAPSIPPAGWYADPAGAPQRRFWDGRAWTDQLA